MTSNDIRNGLGSYGVLSIIIESARYTSLRDGNADLGARVDAYYRLLTYLVKRTEDRSALRNILYEARTEELPPFLPVHYFWGNVGLRITDEIVREYESGADVVVPTANFQHDRIVKRTLPRPQAYAIPAEHAHPFLDLLEKHQVDFQILSEAQTLTAEVTRRNARHPGLEYNDTTSSAWALELRPAEEVTLEPGSVLIPATHGTSGRKAALILEPSLVEGLYEAEPFGGLEDSEGNLPVLRIP